MNVLLEVPTFELHFEFRDDFKHSVNNGVNLCSVSWCKWEGMLLRHLHQTVKERKSGQARSEDGGEGRTMDVSWVVLASWLLGWDSPLLVPHRCLVTFAKAKILGASRPPSLLLTILFSPNFSSFNITAVPAGRAGQGPWVYPALLEPSQIQHGGTQRG